MCLTRKDLHCSQLDTEKKDYSELVLYMQKGHENYKSSPCSLSYALGIALGIVVVSPLMVRMSWVFAEGVMELLHCWRGARVGKRWRKIWLTIPLRLM